MAKQLQWPCLAQKHGGPDAIRLVHAWGRALLRCGKRTWLGTRHDFANIDMLMDLLIRSPKPQNNGIAPKGQGWRSAWRMPKKVAHSSYFGYRLYCIFTLPACAAATTLPGEVQTGLGKLFSRWVRL